MKILIAGPKGDVGGDRLAAVAARVRVTLQAAGVAALVVSPSGAQWEEIRRAEGSWEALYAWAVRSHDGIVLLPTVGSRLSRGCYEMAEGFLRAGKTVAIAEGSMLRKVRHVVRDGDDWKLGYGVAVLA